MRPRPERFGPGQCSVWGFPRQAIAERCAAHVRIEHSGHLLAVTRASVCTVETIHPQGYYIPPNVLTAGVLRPVGAGSFCEWKGSATYWNVVIDAVVLPRVGWSYPDRTLTFAMLRDHVAFYAAPFDRCLVDGETVVPQPGSVYGGWTTSDLAGPFKGIPGSIGR